VKIGTSILGPINAFYDVSGSISSTAGQNKMPFGTIMPEQD
jgi:hypothetical protein